ncbi:MAG: helix-hairpin-helix domain-containing protein [Chloroflexi bacterium]|nr:helix-hairpin-helix domain-containing protein [Chloroflexota bacterium]
MSQWQKRDQKWITLIALLTLVYLIVLGIVVILLRRPTPAPITILPPPAANTPAIPQPLRVYVSGAVAKPDVYGLPGGSTVKDAITAAGGPTENADLDRINLALGVQHQQHVYVPVKGEVGLSALVPSNPSPAGEPCVDINRATAAELETLPGIGPALAERIIVYRQTHGPFTRIEDIQEVSGIGEKTFEKIKDLICVSR